MDFADKYTKSPTVAELAEAFPEMLDFVKDEIVSLKARLPYEKAFKRIKEYDISQEGKERFWGVVWKSKMKTDPDVNRINQLQRFVDAVSYKGTKSLDIEKAKSRNILELYTFERLRKGNTKSFAKCPFHKERTPSFVIYHDGEHSNFHCFSCKKSGDSITFIRELLGLSFPEAVKYLEGI